MESKEVTRKEIEETLMSSGDYVKIDFLNRCLNKNIDFDTKRYVLIQLSKLYEKKGIYREAAKTIKNAADINTTFKGKSSDLLKCTELFVKASSFDEAEQALKQTLASAANENDKQKMRNTVKEFYKIHARGCISKDKRKNAMETYEKLLEFDLNPSEREEIEKELLELYEKLGKIREYNKLRQKVN